MLLRSPFCGFNRAKTKNKKGENKMRLIEWEVNEDDYQEQINIPSEQRKMAEEEGINTEYKQKVAVQIC
jgi:hypothetical protein